jgi:hypothetical protein
MELDDRMAEEKYVLVNFYQRQRPEAIKIMYKCTLEAKPTMTSREPLAINTNPFSYLEIW